MSLVVVLDCQDPPSLARFWTEAIGYEEVGSVEPYLVLVPSDGLGPELLLQRVPEPKAAKNRMHLDIRTDELDREVDRVTALGATRLRPDVLEQAGFSWVVMADPEGNEFCVCKAP